MSKADGQLITIQFTEAITSDIATLVASSFTVTGKEYTYVPGGTLVDEIYAVSSVTRIDARTIQLVILATDRFESVVGLITVSYNASTGNLVGSGGPVASFSKSFTPTGLVAKPRQNALARISIQCIPVVAVTRVFTTNCYEHEHISIVLNPAIVVTNVGTKPL